MSTKGQKKIPQCTVTSNDTSKVVGNNAVDTESVSRSFVCHKCTAVFQNMQTFVTHARACLPSKDFECIDESCPYSFADQSLMLKHFSEVHEGKNEPYKCAHCDQTYSSARTLRHHVRNTHPPDEHHACQLCCKTFTNKFDLCMHRMQHADIKPFGCNLCNAAVFSYSEYLVEHVRICGTTTTVTCPCCKKTFMSQEYYQKHLAQAHTIDQTYDCDQCPKTYKRHASLIKHQQEKHP